MTTSMHSTLLRPSRRGIIGALGALFAAPAIVRAASLDALRGVPYGLGADGTLAPITQGYATESLDYEYWVSMGGTIVRRSARDILAAPAGTYQPWLGINDTHIGSSIAFRPTDGQKKGLSFAYDKTTRSLQIINFDDPLARDPVILRLRQEQDDLRQRLQRAQLATGDVLYG
jgi:hypothetical protein